MSDGSEMAASLAVVSIGTSMYTSFCPPFPRVLDSNPTPHNVEQVRISEMFAGMTTLAVGFALTLVTKSRMPVSVAFTVAVVMTVVYEVSLRRTSDAV